MSLLLTVLKLPNETVEKLKLRNFASSIIIVC